LVNFAYGYFILPESLGKEHRRPFEWKRANPVGSLLKVRTHPEILKLFVAAVRCMFKPLVFRVFF
jgi:DHA1 family tetracycline resistance protein-like MFS transporter